MSTITKYFNSQGEQITDTWWTAEDGTRYMVSVLEEEQLTELGITKVNEPATVTAAARLNFSQYSELIVSRIVEETKAVRRTVSGDLETEYLEAERQAKEYKTNGYTGVVPEYVDSFGAPRGMTGREAADAILAKAERWRAIEAVLRRTRIAYEYRVRTVTIPLSPSVEQEEETKQAFTTIYANWSAELLRIKRALGQ